MTQAEAILEHLKLGFEITPLEALRVFGCLRLGARIWELQRAGHRIESKFIKLPGGKHCASYRLVKRGEQMELGV